MNPDRHCRMCEIIGEGQPKMEDLKAVFEGLTTADISNMGDTILEELRGVAGNCPACMLAAIRQTPDTIVPGFDYKKESDAFWKDINEARAEESYRCY